MTDEEFEALLNEEEEIANRNQPTKEQIAEHTEHLLASRIAELQAVCDANTVWNDADEWALSMARQDWQCFKLARALVEPDRGPCPSDYDCQGGDYACYRPEHADQVKAHDVVRSARIKAELDARLNRTVADATSNHESLHQ